MSEPLLVMVVGESVLKNGNFVNRLATGETISSVSGVVVTADSSSPAATPPTVSGLTHNSLTKWQGRFAGGTDGLFHIKATVGTSDGNTRVGCSYLRVESC